MEKMWNRAGDGELTLRMMKGIYESASLKVLVLAIPMLER